MWHFLQPFDLTAFVKSVASVDGMTNGFSPGGEYLPLRLNSTYQRIHQIVILYWKEVSA